MTLDLDAIEERAKALEKLAERKDLAVSEVYHATIGVRKGVLALVKEVRRLERERKETAEIMSALSRKPRDPAEEAK